MQPLPVRTASSDIPADWINAWHTSHAKLRSIEMFGWVIDDGDMKHTQLYFEKSNPVSLYMNFEVF